MRQIARQRGFEVVEYGAGPLSIARLVSTRNETDDAARRRAEREFPAATFGTIKIYRPFRTANDAKRKHEAAISQGVVDVRPASAVACSPNRCFGPRTIEWNSRLSTCASGRRIGVVDTAVDNSHPALRSRAIQQRAFKPASAAPVSNWHGTGVLTLMAGDSRSGTPGLIPAAKFFVADVFYADSSDQPATNTMQLAAALEWLHDNGVTVVNLSVAGPSDPVMRRVIRDLSAKGMVFIAAAGNEGPGAGPSYPAGYPQVIAVTAVNQGLRAYTWANRGNYIDVAAPGVAIWTAVPGQREGFVTGTSFAVPFVTAMVAAVHQHGRQLSKTEIVRQLRPRDLGKPGHDETYGHGLARAPQHCKPSIPSTPDTTSWNTTVKWPSHPVRASTGWTPSFSFSSD